MNFRPVRIINILSAAHFATLLFAVGIISGAASAQTDQPQEPIADPLDGLCAEIGRPLTATEVAEFDGFVVQGIDVNYREVIGKFVKDRTRSVRYLENGEKTAQFVYTDGRKICLSAPGGEEVTCGVPLVCKSGESDFVMVDSNDDPFVRISRPAKPDPNAPPLPEDYDWVRYAGGTARLTIPSEPIGPRKPTPAKNAYPEENCKVGSGYPALDSAYAYYWSKAVCNQPFAQGMGIAFYLTNKGDTDAVLMGPGTGIETLKGQLRWSFSEKPMEVTVKCSDATDTAIPKTEAEVTNVDVDLIVPPTVVTGDPIIYTKLADETSRYVEDICGKAPSEYKSMLRVYRSAKTPAVDLTLTWDGGLVVPVNSDAPALGRVLTRKKVWRIKATTVFARFIRRDIEAQKTSEILSALRAGGRLPSIADGMRENVVRTLVALTEGIPTWMPWEGRTPDFTNGEFRLSWTSVSRDPVKEFFRTRRQREGWAEIERNLPASSKPSVKLELTCIVPARDATELATRDWVLVDATMISFSRNSMVLRCRAP